jgi:hypothetical protein
MNNKLEKFLKSWEEFWVCVGLLSRVSFVAMLIDSTMNHTKSDTLWSDIVSKTIHKPQQKIIPTKTILPSTKCPEVPVPDAIECADTCEEFKPMNTFIIHFLMTHREGLDAIWDKLLKVDFNAKDSKPPHHVKIQSFGLYMLGVSTRCSCEKVMELVIAEIKSIKLGFPQFQSVFEKAPLKLVSAVVVAAGNV